MLSLLFFIDATKEIGFKLCVIVKRLLVIMCLKIQFRIGSPLVYKLCDIFMLELKIDQC